MVCSQFSVLAFTSVLLTSSLHAFVLPQSNRLNSAFHIDDLLTAKNDDPVTILWAKKRRRKKSIQSNEEDVSEKFPSLDANDLPDFDLEEDTLSSATELSGGDMPLGNSAKTSVTMDLNDPKVLEAMKGTSKKRGDRISKVLTRDQELEKRFQFAGSDVKDPTLPTNLASTRSESGTKQTIGKKAARNEARRRAAIEAKESEKDAESFLSKLPIGQKDGKFDYLKVSDTYFINLKNMHHQLQIDL